MISKVLRSAQCCHCSFSSAALGKLPDPGVDWPAVERYVEVRSCYAHFLAPSAPPARPAAPLERPVLLAAAQLVRTCMQSLQRSNWGSETRD